ncbi:MAG TPA: alpha/beta hydrolase [Longimicrobium sp.]|nr:alpha/beta hydrolase [Longimicrobium sp.]
MRLDLLPVLSLSLLAAGCATISVPENQFFHPGHAALPANARAMAASAGLQIEDVWFRGADSTRLHGLFVRTPGARNTMLYFGGDNFRLATGGAPAALLLRSLGVNGLLVEYRGYGESEGTPTLPLVKDDALRAYDYLAARPDVDRSRIVVHGLSLGSFMAPYVAEQRGAGVLVLEASATSARGWAKDRTPWYRKPFVRVRMSPAMSAEDNVARLRRYRGPLLLVVGANDPVTRPEMSRRLYRASATPPARKRLVVAAGKTHGDAMASPETIAAYRAFLAEMLP